LARLLIENGAIVDARFTAGHTPLHFAAQGNRVNVLTYLLDQGANIEARTNADETAMSESNETPLHCATDFQCPGTVALLLERGANAEAVNIEGQTPLIIAVSRNNEKIISILLNKNVNMEAKDKLGRTALYIAVNNENESIARLLIGKRANVDSRDDDGWTPLFIAQKKGLKEIAILLEKNGAQHIKNPLEQTAPGKLFKSNHLIDFLWIPAGSFLMGSSEIEAGRSENEGPVHKVNFEKGFWMSKNEVTQTLWYEIMQTNPSAFKRGPNLNIPPDSQWLGKTSLGHNDNSSLINGFDNPVEEVSYDDCQKFISKLNEKEASYKYALPTEAQWEYACRAMSKGPFSFNGEISHSKVVYANRNALLTDLGPNSTDTTACVRSGEPNNWGLYNMHGNVSEWCRDSWHENYTGAPVDGSSWNEERSSAFVIRGGTFNSEGNDCRSTVRTFGLKNYRANDVGLRLVLIYK
jgi:formylglycine-generating enzyme required for sulfatase activity